MKPFHLFWFLAGYQPRGWLDPRWGNRYDFRGPELYMDAARMLERGCFDGIVIADQPSIDLTYTGTMAAALRSGNEAICGDPLVVMSMMGAVTQHLGVAATLTTTFHPPFLLARQLNALDHMTKGRAGWNVVTSTRKTDGQNFGVELPEHDLRYDMADEFIELCHKLWQSWEPDAVLLDRGKGVFADPAKVHEVNFKGKWYQSRGPLPFPRSPQVSPLIFQAGGSGRGREFAAQHAECVLSNQNSTKGMKEYVDDVKKRAEKYQKRPPRVLFSIQPIVGETLEAAKEKERAYLALASTEPYIHGGLAFGSMSLGVDFSKFEMDVPIKQQLEQHGHKFKGMPSILFQYFNERPDTTPRDIGLREALKTTIPIVGTAEQVADRMCEIAEQTGADGFMIRDALLPSYILDFVDRIIPALQRRGAFRKEYSGKTLRDNVYEY
ncbi:MAG TPA: NtaA/DmoA family FMN-dependent monooxygenase [Burkholderiales bacterium]|nr:NtaA/DmoA family FMN-dependent monooxygenase [Burkholderiales bacterium]